MTLAAQRGPPRIFRKAISALDLNRGRKRLGKRIVIANARSPNQLPYPEPAQGDGELGGRIVAAAVTVKYSIRRRSRFRAAISIAEMISGVL
jgi:hypothetical protein